MSCAVMHACVCACLILIINLFVVFIFEAASQLSILASVAGFLSSTSDNICSVFPFHLLNCFFAPLKKKCESVFKACVFIPL